MTSKFRDINNCRPVDWGQVLGEGVTNKYPSDIDGILERNGKFLVLEWKHSSVTELPKGQEILLKRLAGLPDFEVFVIYGSYDTWEVDRIWMVKRDDGPKPYTRKTLIEAMRVWWQWASAQ